MQVMFGKSPAFGAILDELRSLEMEINSKVFKQNPE